MLARWSFWVLEIHCVRKSVYGFETWYFLVIFGRFGIFFGLKHVKIVFFLIFTILVVFCLLEERFLNFFQKTKKLKIVLMWIYRPPVNNFYQKTWFVPQKLFLRTRSPINHLKITPKYSVFFVVIPNFETDYKY